MVPPGHLQAGSGAGLLTVATEGMNLLAQDGGALLISTGEGNGQGEFKLFALMVALGFDDLVAAAGA
jgi:hypothetical protein